jgi:hypothetical protein
VGEAEGQAGPLDQGQQLGRIGKVLCERLVREDRKASLAEEDKTLETVESPVASASG